MFRAITEYAQGLGVSFNSPIILAYSCGSDSRFLLDWATTCWSHTNITVLYCDHGLRDTDAELVHLAKLNANIRVKTVKLQITAIAEEQGLSIEMAGRKGRYQAIKELAKAESIKQVLTAHHLNDQAETLLMRLCSGAKGGVGGIQPNLSLDGIQVFRPLLGVSKQDIGGYLQQHNLDWVEDPTNSELKFDRNWVRHHLLPIIRDRYPSADRHLAEFSDYFRQLNQHAIPKIKLSKKGMLIQDIRKLSALQQTGFLRDWLIENTDIRFQKIHLENGVRVALGIINRASLPHNFTWVRNGQYLTVSPKTCPVVDIDIPLSICSEWVVVDALNIKLKIEGCADNTTEKPGDVNTLKFTAFDGGKRDFWLGTLQSSRVTTKMAKSVRKRLQSLKIPVTLRSQIPLLMTDNQLVSVVGFQQSDQKAQRNEQGQEAPLFQVSWQVVDESKLQFF